MKKTTVGIIGTGRFAMVLAALFARDQAWVVRHSSRTKLPDGKTIITLQEVTQCDIIVPVVPISAMAATLSELSGLIKADARPLVVSVCSVMKLPEQWLLSLLPPTADVLITHPVFGPQSTHGGTSFSELKWVWHEIRVRDSHKISALRRFLGAQQLSLLEMSSHDHDTIMAKSQAMSFLFGRLGHHLKLEPTLLDTIGFTHLLENQAGVGQDSQQLGNDMFVYNQHARHQLAETMSALQQIRNEIFDALPEPTLDELRQQIDQLDQEMLNTLSQRIKVVQNVGRLKKKLGLAPLQPQRWREVMERLQQHATKLKLDSTLVTTMWEAIHEEALSLEKKEQL